MFEGIHETVEAGIWDGRYEIEKKNVNYLADLELLFNQS